MNEAVLRKGPTNDWSSRYDLDHGDDEERAPLRRKPPFDLPVEYSVRPEFVVEFAYVIDAKLSRRKKSHAGHQNGNEASPADQIKHYPSYLVGFFSAGLVVFVVGSICLAVSMFYGKDFIKIAGAVLLAIGSVTVIMTLLRGQDIDEQIGRLKA